ncbi:MAG: tRNA pseudouridine(55) synthase TruB [Actinobacteria bacterium]|nr:tRNA pseudouridine(55) synthase TruB [Actinomycetota bacterium]
MLDKPTGITSARAVSKVKRLLPRKTRVGHTGTLDPLASGLLVLLIGRSTRLSRYVTPLDKSYTATARFGAVSDTLDADGDITPLGTPMPDENTIRAALPDFTGNLLQTPPMTSALKREGVRLYDLHRRGVTVERDARPITVHSLTLAEVDPVEATATFEVACTSGTYVRTLISDLAHHLGTGAYLTALRRTRVGHLRIEEATTPADLTSHSAHKHIIQSSKVVAHLPAVEIDQARERAVCSGQRIEGFGEEVFRVEMEGELLAIYRGEDGVARPEVVLCGG